MELLIVIVSAVGIIFFFAHLDAKKVQAALEAYRSSLQALKKDPANSDLRQKTLNLGRIYSNLARDKKGITIFDEVALMNDINAACASTQYAVHAPSVAQQSSSSVEERLSQLQSLREKDLINEEDFLRR